MGSEQSAEVLVADDHKDIRRMLEVMVRSLGYRVRSAADGLQALQMVRESVPAAVLLDVTMPEMSGLEVCRRLRADPSTATIPILLVTADTDLRTRMEGFAAGADDFIGKPFDMAELAARLRSRVEL